MRRGTFVSALAALAVAPAVPLPAAAPVKTYLSTATFTGERWVRSSWAPGFEGRMFNEVCQLVREGYTVAVDWQNRILLNLADYDAIPARMFIYDALVIERPGTIPILTRKARVPS